MAWRLNKTVIKGEIDNRTRGRVTGRVWLVGRTDPLVLNLKGNTYRDIAGRLMTFTNPSPQPEDAIDLNGDQAGTVGDITGSRKVRVPDVPIEEMMRLSKEGKKFPEHLGNAVYIEWFSKANGRVVIESADYQLEISEPEWEMTKAQETKQIEAYAHAIRDYLDQVADAIDTDAEEEEEPEDDQPMDEFQWEKFLKESDARTDKYGKLLDKYEGHPDQQKIVAREMGWTWLEEALDADERGKLKDDDKKEDEPFEDEPELEPNPLTEGVDWIRDKDGHPKHPLVVRTVEVAMAMWHKCDEKGLLGEEGDKDVQDMLFEAQMTGAKLAGALNSLCYDHHRDSGFLVAYLKRALNYLHKALAFVDKVAAKSLVPADLLQQYKTDLFGIREEILKLMERYRRQA
jgi:hypothetical protein